MGSVPTQPGLGANLTWALAHFARLGPGLTRLNFGPERLGSILAHTNSIRLGPGRLGSTWTWADFAQPESGLSWLNLDRAKSNPTQNTIWIIQKYIQSISNPY